MLFFLSHKQWEEWGSNLHSRAYQERESHPIAKKLMRPKCKIILSKMLIQDAVGEIFKALQYTSSKVSQHTDMSHDVKYLYNK